MLKWSKGDMRFIIKIITILIFIYFAVQIMIPYFFIPYLRYLNGHERVTGVHMEYGAKDGEIYLKNKARSGTRRDIKIYLDFREFYATELGYSEEEVNKFEGAVMSCPRFQHTHKDREEIYLYFKNSGIPKYTAVAACLDTHKNDFNPYSDDNWKRCKVAESSPSCPIKMDRPPAKTLANLWGLID